MKRPGELEIIIDELLIKSGVHKSRVRNPLYGEERQLAKDTALIYGDDLEQENEGLKAEKKEMINMLQGNLNDAYEVAHELEFSEINGIFKFLTIEVITSEERSKFMRDEITKHERKLLDFGDTFGDKTWRMQIAIQQSSTKDGTE